MPPSPRKKGKTSRRKKSRGNHIGAFIVIAIFLVTLAVAVVFLAGRIRRPHPASQAGSSASRKEKIYYEEPHLKGDIVPRNHKHRPPEARPRHELPLVAIVIDDMGYNLEVGRSLISSGMNISFAFLPRGPHTAELLAMAEDYRRDRLLHFPMEPANSHVNPGPGAIFLNTPYATLKETFMENLSLVPGVMGINNHMGSRYTQNRAAMGEFLGLMRGRGLFFLDSFTSSNSVGLSLAREMGIMTLRRDVFLDNVQERAAINRQLETLVRVAGRHGSAVGIGHPHRATWKAIVARKGWLARRVRLVGVSRLAR